MDTNAIGVAYALVSKAQLDTQDIRLGADGKSIEIVKKDGTVFSVPPTYCFYRRAIKQYRLTRCLPSYSLSTSSSRIL